MSKDAKPISIDWPLAYNTKQAADILGWPEAFIKQCRKAGCPAFKHSRVYVGELVTWIGNKGEESDIDWSRALKKEQALHEKLKREKTAGNMVDLIEMRADAAAIQGDIFSEIERYFANEMPATCKGMDEYGLRAGAKKFIEQLREAVRVKIEAIGKLKA